MKRLEYETVDDIRGLNRSEYRNMPSECAYCAYKNRPSSSGDTCNGCCMQNYNSAKITKR
jgi:hypothetical protein